MRRPPSSAPGCRPRWWSSFIRAADDRLHSLTTSLPQSVRGTSCGSVDALSKTVDVVVSGHTHQEYVCRRNGKLLTSTGFYGSAVTEIDLTIHPGTGVTSAVANTLAVINDLNTAVRRATRS